MWRKVVRQWLGRGAKKSAGKKETAPEVMSTDVINIFLDKTEPEIKPINQYPPWHSVYIEERSLKHESIPDVDIHKGWDEEEDQEDYLDPYYRLALGSQWKKEMDRQVRRLRGELIETVPEEEAEAPVAEKPKEIKEVKDKEKEKEFAVKGKGKDKK